MKTLLTEYLDDERRNALVHFDDGQVCRVWLAADGVVSIVRYRDSNRVVSCLNERFKAVQDAIRETRNPSVSDADSCIRITASPAGSQYVYWQDTYIGALQVASHGGFEPDYRLHHNIGLDDTDYRDLPYTVAEWLDYLAEAVAI